MSKKKKYQKGGVIGTAEYSRSPQYQNGGIVDKAKFAAIQGLRDEMSSLSGESVLKNFEDGGIVEKSESIQNKLDLAEKLLSKKESNKYDEDDNEDLENLSRDELLARLRKRA